MIGIFLMIFISITLWACYISVYRVLISETSKSAAGKKKSSIVCSLIDSVFSLLFLLILTMWFFWMIGLFITEWTKWRKHNWYLKVVDRETMAKASLSEDSPEDSRRSPEDFLTPVSPTEKDITANPHCINIEQSPTV
nr:uncharacterized protein LOC107448891 [Parasteatoda tepidariorum]